MKNIFVTISLAMSAFFATNVVAQEEVASNKGFYLGGGFGLDYGGIGVQAEYMATESLGFFAGLGYNFDGAGFNVGAEYKFLPEKEVNPKLMAMYGYNGVLVVENAEHYNDVSYGISFGGGIDIKLGKKGTNLSLALLVPIRSKSFMDNYDAVKDNPRISIEQDLLPVAFSVGVRFPIR